KTHRSPRGGELLTQRNPPYRGGGGGEGWNGPNTHGGLPRSCQRGCGGVGYWEGEKWPGEEENLFTCGKDGPGKTVDKKVIHRAFELENTEPESALRLYNSAYVMVSKRLALGENITNKSHDLWFISWNASELVFCPFLIPFRGRTHQRTRAPCW